MKKLKTFCIVAGFLAAFTLAGCERYSVRKEIHQRFRDLNISQYPPLITKHYTIQVNERSPFPNVYDLEVEIKGHDKPYRTMLMIDRMGKDKRIPPHKPIKYKTGLDKFYLDGIDLSSLRHRESFETLMDLCLEEVKSDLKKKGKAKTEKDLTEKEEVRRLRIRKIIDL